MGLLIALDVVAATFLTIKTPFLKVGVSFIPVAMTGILFGPALGGVGAGLADILQYALFSMGMTYLPGITIDAVLSGAVYGFLLHGKKPSLVRCFLSSAINELIISGLFTTFWLYLAFPGQTFFALFLTRIVKSLVMTPIEAVVLYGLWRIFIRSKALFGGLLTEKN
jgi:Protein of unknown function (DUF1393).